MITKQHASTSAAQATILLQNYVAVHGCPTWMNSDHAFMALVKYFQLAYNAAGGTPALKVDGEYGTNTDRAYMTVTRRNSLCPGLVAVAHYTHLGAVQTHASMRPGHFTVIQPPAQTPGITPQWINRGGWRPGGDPDARRVCAVQVWDGIPEGARLTNGTNFPANWKYFAMHCEDRYLTYWFQGGVLYVHWDGDGVTYQYAGVAPNPWTTPIERWPCPIPIVTSPAECAAIVRQKYTLTWNPPTIGVTVGS